MRGTYYADTNFTEPVFHLQETPNRDWGLYPPVGLPSNNFSVVWEGELQVPIDGAPVDGWLGVAVAANCSARLFVDGVLVSQTEANRNGNILGNIQLGANTTQPPPGGAEFRFVEGAKHHLRLEFKAFNLFQKIANFGSLNAEVELFWNLVDREDAVQKVCLQLFLCGDSLPLSRLWMWPTVLMSLFWPSALIGTPTARMEIERLWDCR
jgi:hypothetical protein